MQSIVKCAKCTSDSHFKSAKSSTAQVSIWSVLGLPVNWDTQRYDVSVLLRMQSPEQDTALYRGDL